MQFNKESMFEYYDRYKKLNTEEYNKNQYQSNDFNSVFKQDKLSIIQEPDVKYETRDHYLVVSSAERDPVAYPSSSNFVINLSKEYKNIISVELIQAILPDKNNVTSEPYLLLKINEFEECMDTNNKPISDSFAMLAIPSPVVSDTFIHIDKRIFENVTLNYRTPKANLSKLTVQITDSAGTIFNFGGPGSLAKATQCVFVFKITTSEGDRKQFNNRNIY
jgi:hypothetical protein